jgi:hypothetical protein
MLYSTSPLAPFLFLLDLEGYYYGFGDGVLWIAGLRV